MWFKKKTKSFELLELNQERLLSEMQKIGEKFNSYKQEDCMTDMRRLIHIGKNLAVMNCATAKNEEQRIMSQAKLEVFNELQHFIEVSIERKVQERREGKKAVSGTFNTFRRANHQAGSAI